MKSALFLCAAFAVAAMCASSLTITGSTFKNLSADSGAAIHVTGATTVSITGTTFSDVHADDGGAIYVTGETILTVTDSKFLSVSSENDGAAIYIADASPGTTFAKKVVSDNIFAAIGSGDNIIYVADTNSEDDYTGNTFYNTTVPAVKAIGSEMISLAGAAALSCNAADAVCEGNSTVTDGTSNLCGAATDLFGSAECPTGIRICDVPISEGGAGDCPSNTNCVYVDSCGSCFETTDDSAAVTDESECPDDTDDTDGTAEVPGDSSSQTGGDNDEDAAAAASSGGLPVAAVAGAAVGAAIVGAVVAFMIAGRKGGKKDEMSLGGGSSIGEMEDLSSTTAGAETFSLDDTSLTSSSML